MKKRAPEIDRKCYTRISFIFGQILVSCGHKRLKHLRICQGKGFGIPNTYFTETTSLTIEERRQQVLIQLRSLGVLTEQDFIDLAALLGITITIEHAIDYATFPMIFPIILLDRASQARFIMIVNAPASLNPFIFPMTFPITFSSTESNILETLFNILKPANTQIIFNYIS